MLAKCLKHDTCKHTLEKTCELLCMQFCQTGQEQLGFGSHDIISMQHHTSSTEAMEPRNFVTLHFSWIIVSAQ